MRLPTRFPTVVGLVLFLTLVGGFVVGFERLSRGPTVASPSSSPKDVEFTNVSDTSFTVSWTTEAETTAALLVSNKKEKARAYYDERDLSGKPGKYQTHMVTVRSVTPETTYNVSILSNRNENGPYTVRTGPTLPGSTPFEPAFGSVRTTSDEAAAGGIVYLTLRGGQKLSTLVTASGSWLVPLNLTRTEDLRNFIAFNERIDETILVRFDGKEAYAVTDTRNDSPVPEMVLGKTYDFRRQQAEAPRPPDVLGATTISLVKPQEGAALTTALPLVQGTGIPGNVVTITLGITSPIGGTSTVGSDGIWRYTPEAPLSPGKQSVTMTTADETNKPVAITHTFEILKSGTQVLGTATPSATPALPAGGLTPTPTSTLSAEPPPQSGSTLPTIILLILGLGLLTSGTMVLLK